MTQHTPDRYGFITILQTSYGKIIQTDMQGMQKVNTGLGNLFSEAPDEDEEEALVYRRPKDPALARASLPPSASVSYNA